MTAVAMEVENAEPATKKIEEIVEESKDEEAVDAIKQAEELLDVAKEFTTEKNHSEASNCLSEALGVMVEEYGEWHANTALYYFKYGASLLEEFKASNDCFGDALKASKDNFIDGQYDMLEEAQALMNQLENAIAGGEEEKGDEKNDEKDDDGDEKDDDGDEKDDDGDEKDNDDDGASYEEESEGDTQKIAWDCLEMARLIYSKHCEKTPKNMKELAEVHEKLGDVHQESDQWKDAYSEFTNALKIHEQFSKPRVIAGSHMSLAMCSLYQNNRAAALGHYIACRDLLQKFVVEKLKAVGLLTSEAPKCTKELVAKYTAAEHPDHKILTELQEDLEALNERIEEMKGEGKTLKQMMKEEGLTESQAPVTTIGFGAQPSENSGPVNDLGLVCRSKKSSTSDKRTASEVTDMNVDSVKKQKSVYRPGIISVDWNTQ